MQKVKLVNQLAKSIVGKASQIISALTDAALNSAFVNESCKSTGQVSKSQVIYRKIEDKSKKIMQGFFRENTIKFLRLLKIY